MKRLMVGLSTTVLLSAGTATSATGTQFLPDPALVSVI
jgi:hypothetical protein